MRRRSIDHPQKPRRSRPHGRTPPPETAKASVPQSYLSIPFLWPLVATAAASEATAAFLNDVAHIWGTSKQQTSASNDAEWATRNRIALELSSLRLRDFSQRSQGRPTVICAPYALHLATVADFASGHSLVEALRANGVRRVYVTEWRSATPEMRFLSIDSYLADLNIAVDELDHPVDLIGLCQGGWMALVYAARFPKKVRRLVLAGAPVDIGAGESFLSASAAEIPLATFEEIVRLGDGRVLGQRVLDLWAPALAPDEASRVLQMAPGIDAAQRLHLERRFRRWYALTVDLPGTYYLQVVSQLFKENRIAAGRFEALGRRIDLGSVHAPTFLLAGRDDELVSVDQLLATARHIGTPREKIEISVEPCGHLSLFLGAETLRNTWSRIADWLLHETAA